LERGGQQAVVLNPLDARELGIALNAVVQRFSSLDTELKELSDRPGMLVRVFTSDDVLRGTIHTDQTIRNGLGAEKQEFLTVNSVEVGRSIVGSVFLGQPNYISARVKSADLVSVEQNICLLDPLAMSFLGVSEGDSVVVEGIPLSGSQVSMGVRLRVFGLTEKVSNLRQSVSGGGLENRFPDVSEALGVFPDLPDIYLDAAIRTRLGLKDAKLCTVRIRASRGYQFVNQMREVLLIVTLAFIGIISVFNSAVLGSYSAGLIGVSWPTARVVAG